ncbi:aryl-alcohol dehydrogenase [Trametes elegans]|nr:aryl-alcohol dehydrogenase [Trametes elegans]
MASSFNRPPPPPSTKLGRHRQLSPLAGVHVSPLCLGGATIGDQWGELGFGHTSKEGSFALLDAFYDAGGNFIDTANNYQNESSEAFIGEWMEMRGVRDQMVVSTKYSNFYKAGSPEIRIKSSYVGNNVKSMHISVEQSLEKLRTSYIDILFVHFWDFRTSIEEVVNGLHNLVASGKVLYLGISDTPAWVVSRANTYARLTGKTPFVIYQGAWSVLQRDLEREIIPMVRAEGMALAPWGVLAGGKIRTDEEEERRRQTGENGRTTMDTKWERTEQEKRVVEVLKEVAPEAGAVNVQAVAIAYVMQKMPYVFPIIGGRKVEQLTANLAALDVALTPEHIRRIEGVVPFDLGFPSNFIGDGTGYPSVFYQSSGPFDAWPAPQPIIPKSV